MKDSRKTTKSRAAFERASKLFPGGVNSPVRAFKAVGGTPVFLARGQGAHVWDVDGNRYLDFMGSWGPLILGHADPDVLQAIRTAAANGTTFGASTELEIALERSCARRCPRWSGCGSSPPAPRRPCQLSGWPEGSPGATRS